MTTVQNSKLVFNEENTIVITESNALNDQIFSCDYIPEISNNDDLLKLRINNLVLSENSSIEFKIVFNNQYPNMDISYQEIREVYVNGVSRNIKYNNEDEAIELSHYILQSFIVERDSENEYEIFSRIIRLPIDSKFETINDINILAVKDIALNNNTKYSYYDISYNSDYYKNTNEVQLDSNYNDRNKLDISINIPEKPITDDEFDNFIVNLYEGDGTLVDTSGNEDDETEFVNKDSIQGFKFNNLILGKTYSVKLMPAKLNSNNTYKFAFADFFRLKEIHIMSNDSIDKSIFKSIGYKTLNSTSNYSIIDIERGIKLLETDVTNIYKFQITTPNVYPYFRIVLQHGINVGKMELFGDRENSNRVPN